MAVPRLRRLVTVIAGIVLALGLAAGMLCAGQAAAPEYLPISRAVLGLGGLGLGFLLGRALRPLGQWRPPVPLSAESAAPFAESPGRIWLRSMAAGFWVLAAVEIAAALLLDLLISPPVITSSLFPMLLPAELLFGALLLFVVPLAIARGAIANGEGLPRWSLAAAAAAAWAAGMGLFLGVWAWIAFVSAWRSGAGLDLGQPLVLVAVPAAAAGTPILIRRRRLLRGGAGSLLLAALTLGAAWLLYACLNTWWSPPNPLFVLVWLLSGCLLWGGSAAASLVVTVAQRQGAAAARSDARRVNPLALAAGGLAMFLLGLIPIGLWVLLTLLPRPMPTALPAPMSYSNPNPMQPGGLPIPGPALVSPAAGAALTGPAAAAPIPSPTTPVWIFTWRPPRGAAPGDAYQFTLWSPGVAAPVVQVVVPGTQLRMSASSRLAPPPVRIGPPGRPAALPPSRRWPSGPWTWRVRLVRPGQGAGQWSEARPLKPVSFQGPLPGSRPPLRPPFVPPQRG